MIKKIIAHSNFWPLVIVIFFGLLAGRHLLTPGYFNMHDDLQMMRQLEMEKCFFDGQIPCRWVPDMGYGFGFPLFNYYPPLPYLLGEVFRGLHFSFIDTVKVIFLLSFIFSGITMYFLSREFWGRYGAVVSSVFYIWAPYHSVDIFVRGAMNEAWALVWFPVIFFTSYKLLNSQKGRAWGWIIGLGLSWAGLLLSHNLMVLIFTPVFAVWCLIHLVKNKHLKIISILRLFLAGILAVSLSAFFTLPAIFEQKYVQVNTLVAGYYEYVAHFASLGQLLFSRFWGYGPSAWGVADDRMSFQIGHVHWILSIIIFTVLLYRFFKKKLDPKLHTTYFILLFLFSVGWFAAFMTHSKSTQIWQTLPFLKFVQFPWRFLTIVIFSFSFISGSVVMLTRSFGRLRMTIIGLLIILLVIVNWNYFKPEHGHLGPLTDEQKFSGAAWGLQQTAGIYDYLPIDAYTAPKEPRKFVAEILRGDGNIKEEKSGTNWASFKLLDVSKQSTVRIDIFKFPNWKVYVDGKDTEVFIPDEEKWGRMWVTVPGGSHDIMVKLLNTPLRSVSNIISLFTWIGLLTFIAYGYSKKVRTKYSR